MHVFLTGPIQMGKSTAIGRALYQLRPLSLAGFRTIAGPAAEDGSSNVHIIGASEKSPTLSETNCVLRRNHVSGRFEPRPEVFDEEGIKILRGAENASLILMDEIGRAEANAPAFSDRIFQLLNGPVPILGVVQIMSHTPLAESIRRSKNVALLTLDLENRDRMPEEICRILAPQLKNKV